VIARVYLDNVITSGWVLKDLKPTEEMQAVERLYALHDASVIKRHVCRGERLRLLRHPRHERSASQALSNRIDLPEIEDHDADRSRRYAVDELTLSFADRFQEQRSAWPSSGIYCSLSRIWHRRFRRHLQATATSSAQEKTRD
jgi:hypothetical protein